MSSSAMSSTAVTDITSLPTEVLEKIFESLSDSVDDLLAISRVCFAWHLTASRLIESHVALCLEHDLHNTSKILSKSARQYKHWLLQNSDVRVDGDFGNFWKSISQDLESLTVRNCFVREQDFVHLLSGCGHMKTLKLQQLEHTFMTVSLLEDKADQELVRLALRQLQYLEVRCERYVSDSLLDKLVSITPPLVSLSLASCNISYQDAIHKRFYPAKQSSPSEFVATFARVLEWIRGMVTTLRHLDLSRTRIDSNSVGRLVQVPHLQLTSLCFAYCDQITNASLEQVCKNLPLLQHLDLTGCYRLSEPAICFIEHSLPHLEWFSVQGCGAVSACSVLLVVQSHDLVYLDAGATDSSSCCAVLQPMYRLQPRLRHLGLAGVSLDARQVVLVAAGAPHLTHLDLSVCAHSVKNCTLQMLSGLLLHLRVLLLSTCCLLTDAGFMGECYHDSSLNHNPLVCPDCLASIASKKTLSGVNLTTSPRRVQLYSRRVTCTTHPVCHSFYDYDTWDYLAEAIADETLDIADPEVLKEKAEKDDEAAQKLNSAQPVPDTIDTILNFKSSLRHRLPASIVNLRGLRKLSLCGVFKLTDHSLVTAFHFPDLQYLNLSQCAQITSVGLGAVASRSTALQELLLARCDSVDDVVVQALVHHLLRLRRLHLQHCSQLTSDSLDSLQWRSSLRYLDITQCTGMLHSAVEHFIVQCTNVKVITLNTHYLQPPSASDAVLPPAEAFSAPTLTPTPRPPPLPLLSKVKRRIFRPWLR
ncbi:F-box domain [Trinorchestia longiramus]|nr:F-box domain [Trinorchestia longiramus]